MDQAQIVALVGQFGFPMVVSGYLLLRMESTIKAFGDKLASLTLVMAQLASKEGVKCE